MSLILSTRFDGVPAAPPLPDLSDYTYEREGANIDFTWYGLDIHPNGTSIYMVQSEGSSSERQVALNTPWSVISYGTATAGIANVTNREGCRIRQDDGTSFWTITNGGTVHKYNLTTPYSLGGSSSVPNIVLSSLAGAGAITETKGLFIKPDGTTLWVSSLSNSRLVEFSMNPAWDISTMAYIKTVSFNNCQDIWFNSNGSRLYYCGGTTVRQYNLVTPWDIDVLGPQIASLNLTGHVVTATALTFKPDLSVLYVMDRGGSGNYQVNQYIAS